MLLLVLLLLLVLVLVLLNGESILKEELLIKEKELTFPRWAQKLIFHIRIVKRNRNEIEAPKKNQIFSTQEHERK